MTDDNPFLISDHQTEFRVDVAKPPQSRWLLWLGGGFVLCLLVCCGLGTVVYQSVFGSLGRSVQLPDGPIDFESDAARFNQALAKARAELAPNRYGDDVEIAEFMQRVVVMSREGKEIPFSADEFAAAVSQQPAAGGGLGFLQRIQLKQTLELYLPTPDLTDEGCQVLAVRRVPEQPYAEIDLLVYSGGVHVDSYRWFLVYHEQDWSVYDWTHLEYGRRISAEYALFFSADGTEQYGYDEAMERLVKAQTAWYDGEHAEARRLLEVVRQMPMLPGDRSLATLRAAYTWMAIDQYDQALKTLESIADPDQLWGVWPAIADCHLTLENYDQALIACNRALKNSPDHVTVHALLAQVYDGLGDETPAAQHAAVALRVSPRDDSNFYKLAGYERKQDLDLLLRVAALSDERSLFLSLLWRAQGDADWAQSLVAELQQRDDVPSGFPELAAASLARSRDGNDDAARLYAQVITSTAPNDFIEHAYLGLIAARGDEDDYAKLFQETPDLERTISLLCIDAFNDELYADDEALLAAINELDSRVGPVNAESPPDPLTAYRLVLRGYTHYNLAHYADAVIDLDAGVSVYDQLPDLQADDDVWIFSSVDYYLSDAMLEEGQFKDYVTKYIDDGPRMYELGRFVVAAAKSVRERFLEFAETSEDSIVKIQVMRLKAAQAKEAGDADACDRWHVKAIKESGSMMSYVDDTSADVLVSERATDLAWHRIDPDLDLAAAPLERKLTVAEQQRHYTAAIRESTRIFDIEMVNRWNAAVEPYIDEFEDTARIEFRRITGDFWKDTGDFENAAVAYADALRVATKTASWQEYSLRDSLLETLVADRRWGSLTSFGQRYPRTDEKVDPSAIADLASGDSAALKSKLSSVDDDDVADWLGSRSNFRLIGRHSDEPWARKLLQRSPVAIPYFRDPPSASLFFPAGHSVSEQMLSRAVSVATGSESTVLRLSDPETDDDAVHWVATTADGQRFGIVDFAAQYETTGSAIAWVDRLRGPVRRVSIESIDGKHSAHQRVIAVAGELADGAAFLLEFDDFSGVWFGQDLAELLAGDAQPLRFGNLAAVRVVPAQIDQTVSNELSNEAEDVYLDHEYWKQTLGESGGPCPVEYAGSASVVNETIPAEVVGLGEDGYRIVVRLSRPSRLRPTLIPGVEFLCRPDSLRAVSK